MKRLAIASLVLAALFAAPAGAAPVPDDATWEQAYFPSVDGTQLHADILRPKGVPAGTKVPTILTVSPYTGHSYEAPASVPDIQAQGPSGRFYDFLEASKLFKRGYAYVIVDLRGHGGSAGGCNDWGGNGEQGDVKAAVEYVASRDWSNGKVGMFGKSYDGWTGLMGVVQQPKGLAAVVSQEPVYDGYRYLYMNRVPFLNRYATGAEFEAGAYVTPATLNDDPQYLINGFTGVPACAALNYAMEQIDDPSNAFWVERNLVPKAKGKTTPLFLTQGFLEDNTKPDAAWEFFNNVAGYKRGWFGQWDHVRGYEKGGGAGGYKMGRGTFVDEVMRFYDHFLKDGPAITDEPIAVQSGDGRWRSEQAWPPADSTGYDLRLKPGSYADADSGADNGDASAGGTTGVGIWTVTPPFANDAIFSGTPKLDLNSDASTLANVVADVYVISSKGRAQLISRGASLGSGSSELSFELYGNDWPVKAGERIGVLLTAANDEWWSHIRSQSTVTVSGGTITLPFLRYARTPNLDGGISLKLGEYRDSAPFDVPGDVLSSAVSPLSVPALLPKPSLTARARAAGRRVTVTGRAPKGARVLVTLLRGRVAAGKRTVTARRGTFTARFTVRRAGSYTAALTSEFSAFRLAKRARVRVR